MPTRVDQFSPALAPSPSPPSPAATRLGRARWLDARLLIGVLLVLGSVLLGARVMSAADDTTVVWAAQSSLQPGVTLTADDLTVTRVSLGSVGNRYVSATEELPPGLVLARPVGAGELLPADAVRGAAEATDVRFVTVAVPRLELPVGTTKGSLVDVWVAPSALDRTSEGATSQAPGGAEPAAGRAPSARLLLRSTTVESADSDEDTFGAGEGSVAVVLAVTTEAAAAAPSRPTGTDASDEGGRLDTVVGDILTASRGSRLYLVGVPTGTP